MTDNYVLALEKDRDTRLAELERCRSEVERFVGEVDRLTRERDEARRALLLEQQVRESHRESADDLRRKLDLAERERDEARALCEQLERGAIDVIHERAEAIRQRDEAHRDWQAGLDDNAALRAKHGARPDEAFFQFVAGLADGLAAAESWKARAEALHEQLQKTNPIVRAAVERAEAAEAELTSALTKMYNALVAFGAPESQPFDDAVATLLDRLQAAEADNAALVNGIGAFHEAWKTGRDTLALVALLRLTSCGNPGAALLALHDAVRQYQHRDEPDTLATFRRLMEERRRASEYIPPEQMAAQNANWANEMREQQRFYAERLRVAEARLKRRDEQLVDTVTCHEMLCQAGVGEIDECGGFIGLQEHIRRTVERLRAAEKVVEAAREYVSGANPTLDHPMRPLFDAFSAYDAAKEGA